MALKVRLVVDALVAVKAVMKALAEVRPVDERLVVDALVAGRLLMNALVKLSPVPERLVVDALVEKSLVIVPAVVDELLKYA